MSASKAAASFFKRRDLGTQFARGILRLLGFVLGFVVLGVLLMWLKVPAVFIIAAFGMAAVITFVTGYVIVTLTVQLRFNK